MQTGSDGTGRKVRDRRLWFATLFLALAAAIVLAACGGSGGTTTTGSTSTEESEPAEAETAETTEGGIAAAPEFTSEELFEPAGENWITNGGGTTNDRFS